MHAHMVPQRPIIRFCSFRPGLGRPASCTTTIRIPKHEYAGSKSQSLLGKLVHDRERRMPNPSRTASDRGGGVSVTTEVSKHAATKATRD